MNLTGLQQELRALEKKLSLLQNEIEDMKPKADELSEQKFNFITSLASKHPLKNVAIQSAPEHVIKNYVSLLSFVALASENALNEKLLYLMRIVFATKFQCSVQEVCRLGMDVKEDEMEERCQDLVDYKHVLIADSLILVNLANTGSHKELSLIADIAKILEINREDLYVISKVVCSYLTDDYAPLEGFIGNGEKSWCGAFRQYIPLEWLEKQRIEVLQSNRGVIGTENVRELTVLVPSSKVVEAGETLLAINYKDFKDPFNWMLSPKSGEEKVKSLSSPKNGLLYYCWSQADLLVKSPFSSPFHSSVLYKMDSSAKMYIVSIFDDLNDVDQWLDKLEKNAQVIPQ